MSNIDPKRFHRLLGLKKTRIAYQASDFLDYVLMTIITALVIRFAYGPGHWIAMLGTALCVVLLVAFIIRHGVELIVPVALRRPQDFVYMLVHKLQNMQPMYVVALAVFVLENYLIMRTPSLPHKVDLMRGIATTLFHVHFAAICAYRTVILVDHLRKRQLVRDMLMQTVWRPVMARRPSAVPEILHAYFTGILTHLVLLAPWYFVIQHASFSVVFLPAVCLINIATHFVYMKGYNAWFYRDHWLGHNSELEFLYLHGTHHDAIPSGLIGVSGNGHLEGFLRHTLGNPTPVYNPVIAFLLNTLEVQQDIKGHQYIPGVFPRQTRKFHEVAQHSTHHYGRLEPYGIGLRSPPAQDGTAPSNSWFTFPPREIMNSIELDEQLTGFQWDNPRYRHFLGLFDRYETTAAQQPAAEPHDGKEG